MSTLHLTLKKKWYDMIESGEKLEEYREIKPYWIKRIMDGHITVEMLKEKMLIVGCHKYTFFEFWKKEFETVTFRNGYQKDAPTMVVEFKGIDIGEAKPEWSDNWQGDVFRIKLGKIISKK